MPSLITPAFCLSAWIDESVVVGPIGGSGTYTMAAVVLDDGRRDELRRLLTELTIKPGVRLHWVAESVSGGT